MKRLLITWCLPVLAVLWASYSQAQILGPQPRGQQGNKTDTPAGPAEAAPEAEKPELPPMPPWPGQETKKVNFFDLKGYFRFRADMFNNLNLGMGNAIESGHKAPFYVPLSEHSNSNFSCAARANKAPPGGDAEDRDLDAEGCPDDTLGGANIRLRLEPTINVSERVRVHAQIDIFDNLVMGSTPNGVAFDGKENTRSAHVPLIAFSDTQAPPIAGKNSRKPAIIVKRAWAEIGTPFGQIRVGRMPSNWGLGLLANNGSCWDCDYGDSADRVMFATKLAGHTFAMGYDFASNGPTSMSIDVGKTLYDGQAVDLENLDDVDQLFWVAGRIDKPDVIKDKLDRGELVLNYGMYLVWRQQDFDYAQATGLNQTQDSLAKDLIERHAWAVIPDLWFKLMWKNLYIEVEGVLIAGTIENTASSIKATADAVDILQVGWAFRSRYSLLNKTLHVGLEVGMATGDEVEITDLMRRRRLKIDPNSTHASINNEFRFDPDYHVDLILFREIMGTVANATYFKPSIQYDIVDTFGAKLDMIYSIANVPVAYPGNSPHLGVEFDLDIFYRNPEDGFYAGLAYGVLIPLAGLDRPASGTVNGGDAFQKNGNKAALFENHVEAEVAHTLQARMIVKF